MSYCRWSSDDFQCDVYVYESTDGYQIHVATSRKVIVGALPPQVSPLDDFDAWWKRKCSVDSMLEACESEPIGLDDDGKSFVFGEPGECADELSRLKRCGYNVPDYAIDALREEQCEEAV